MGIIVKVFKDAHGVYPDGSVREISSASQIDTGVGYLSMVEVLEGRHNFDFANKQLLRVDVPGEGHMYVDDTIESFNDKLSGTQGPSVGGNDAYTWIGDVDVPAGNIISDSRLNGINIQTITKGGLAIYNVTYIAGSPSKIDLTSNGGLSSGEIIQITYKR